MLSVKPPRVDSWIRLFIGLVAASYESLARPWGESKGVDDCVPTKLPRFQVSRSVAVWLGQSPMVSIGHDAGHSGTDGVTQVTPDTTYFLFHLLRKKPESMSPASPSPEVGQVGEVA